MSDFCTHKVVKDLDSDLHQGDILRQSDELLRVFQRHLRHFEGRKYTAFLVTTQSCDLAKHGKKICYSQYITLAPIRPFGDVLHQILSQVKPALIAGKLIVPYSQKGDAEQLVGRILNQNEQKLGVFYIQEGSIESGIVIPSIAMLRLSVTLKRDHYQLLQRARTSRLTPTFAAKLGWLIAHLYSRVAVPDWYESLGQKRFREMVTEHLEGALGGGEPAIFVEDKKLYKAKEQFGNLENMTESELNEFLEDSTAIDPIREFRDCIEMTIKQHIKDATQEQINRVCNILCQDKRVTRALRKPIYEG